MTLTKTITSITTGTHTSTHLGSRSSAQRRSRICHSGQLSSLCIAVSAALGAMLPTQGLAQQVIIYGTDSDYNLASGDLTVASGGSIVAYTPGIAVQVDTGAAVGTFHNAGYMRSTVRGVAIAGLSSMAALNNSGESSSYDTNVEVQGSLGILNNSNWLSGSAAVISVTGTGTITSINNSATGIMRGTRIGVSNAGQIQTIDNQGDITGENGISNSGGGTIGVLINGGTINDSVENNGILNGPQSGTLSAHIGSLSNSGLIASTGTIDNFAAVNNLRYGTIGNLSNTGTILGAGVALRNAGQINTLTNTGLIQGTGTLAAISNRDTGTIGNLLLNGGTITGATGISNAGLITNLSNNALLLGSNTGISNSGSIGTLSNSGLIRGNLQALTIGASGSVGAFNNNGTVAGNVSNLSSNALTINGASGTLFGVLTGSSGSINSAAMGSILSGNANLVFGSGNILLNNNINVGTNTVSNLGSTLQVNNHLTIAGNYSQGANATLLIGVNDGATATGSASDTGYGYVVVQGDSTIAAGSTIGLKKTNNYGFASGQRYVALITTGTANYTASTLNYKLNGYSVTGANVLDGGNTNLVLTLGTAVNSLATTSNAVSTLNHLFNYSGANVNLLNVFNAAAALGSSAEANKAGAMLSPTANTVAAVHSSTAATTQIVSIATTHVDSLRVAQASGNNGGNSGIATGERKSDWAAWGQAFGGSAHQDMRDSISGFRSSYNGLVLGADRLVSERWRAGALLSYAGNSVSGRDDNTGSWANVKSYGLLGYGSYAADNWYLDVVAGAIEHKYNSNRVIDFAGFSGIANGRFDGRQYTTSVQAGMPFKLDGAWENTTVTPIAGLGYSTTRQSAYKETGGNGAALNVGTSDYTSVKSELGVKLERAISTSYGELVPAVQVGWRHEFRDRAVQSIATFAADSTGTTSFTTSGATPVRDTGALALSATLLRHNNMSFVARYTLESGSGYTAQTGDLRLRYQF